MPGTVPQAVVAQLELSGFPGVLVTKVMPDSPAAKAGLQENDVIIKLGDISLSGPRSVTEALSEKVPGDKITAVFYRKGKRETADVTLDGGTLSAEEILAAQGDPRTQPRVVPSVRRQAVPPAGMAARPNLPQRILDMQQMMDDFLRDSAIDDSRMDDIIGRMNLTPGAAQMLRSLQNLHQMPMPPMGKVSGGGQSTSSVRMSDANGTIVVSSSSKAGTTVHVTDSAGKVLYSGPYNTPEEKEAVPEAVRERLKNIETNFCF
ncbi:pDZ/DHR/GLGF domain protein [Akkermansia sp. CAG:344]|nr:pDZ/DHR/GLGF domain protein [Akkermansia sp. CAG:344]